MKSSRSNGSTSRRWLVVVALGVVVGLGTAHAERKRVVVLPFDGDAKAENFHAAVVKMVKKSHTVVSAEKWDGAAGDLKLTDKNIKKVAKKLKLDGVIEGRVEKRRDQYLIKLKLHAGTNGSVVGSVDTKAETARLDGSASRDLRDELMGAIGELESVRGAAGDGDETPTKPKGGNKKTGDDDEDPLAKPGKKKIEEPIANKKIEEPAKPAHKKFGGGKLRGDDPVAITKPDDEDLPSSKRSSKTKKVAAKAEGEADVVAVVPEPGVRIDPEKARSPGHRAFDVTLGLDVNTRRLSWQHDADLAPSAGVTGQGRPPAYKGQPSPGAVFDLAAFPHAFGHGGTSMLNNLGFTITYEQALLISSKVGDEKKDTAASRYAFGGVFRFPIGKSAKAPVIGARLRYGGQKFEIAGGVDIPNVNYGILEPGLLFRIPVSDQLILNLDASYLKVVRSGAMQQSTNYGAATVSGYEIQLGADYALAKAIFARGTVNFETINHKFDGDGMLTTARDSDPEQDVFGARDTYFGVAVTIGYLY